MKPVYKIPAIFTILSIFSFFSCSKKISEPQGEICLGTVCSVNLFESGSEKLYREIFSLLSEIENKFSVNLSSSEISKINSSAGKEVQVSEDVYFVLSSSIKISELSEGAFDPTVGSLVKLWGINTENARVPSNSEINSALKKINYRKLELSERDGKFFVKNNSAKPSEISIDLGGIAKGYACDKIVEILKARKVKRAIVDLGGNIFTYGKKPDGTPWKVGIKNPENPEGKPILGIPLNQGTVVTSGNYERFFEKDGIRYHHILDTKTGFPVQNGISSTTVVCENSMLADALSTTLFSLGKEKGKEFLQKLKQDEFFQKFNPTGEVIFIEENNKITRLRF